MIRLVKGFWNKFNAMTPVAKSSIALIFAKFFAKGLAMISNPIFTRIMPPSEYGIISTFTSWQSVLYILATLNMSQGVFNNGMIDYKNDRDGFTYSVMWLANLCTLLCAGIYVLFYAWLRPLFDMPDSLMIIMFIYFLFTPAYNYWMGRQRFEYKYKSITAVAIGFAFFSTVAGICLVLLANDSEKAIAKIMGSESVAICVGIIFYIYSSVKAKGRISVSYWKYALSFNLPLIPHYLSMYALSSLDRIMITKMVNTEATAIYNVAYTVASILLIFWNSIDASYAPWVYQSMENKNYEAIARRGTQILIVFAVCSFMATLFSPEIMAILAPPSYHAGIYVIPAVSVAVFFTAIYTLYMRIELYLKKTKVVMIGTLLAAVLNLLLNYIFIPIYGFYAAGYSTLVCYALLAIFHYMNLRHFGYKNIFDNKVILWISVLNVLSIVVVVLLYQNVLLRYGFIVILMVVVIWNYDWFKAVVKKQKDESAR